MKNRALLLIDFQKGIESPSQQLYRLPAVLDKVNQRIAVYRQHHAPIIFVQHEEIELPFGSDSWQLFEKLDAQPTDFFIRKTHANAFYQTNLNDLLTEHDIQTLEIAGVQTEFCVDTTIRMAHGLGYTCLMTPKTTSTIWAGRFLTFLPSINGGLFQKIVCSLCFLVVFHVSIRKKCSVD